MREASEVLAGPGAPRRYRYGSALCVGVSWAAFGLRRAGHHNDASYLCLESQKARAAHRRYWQAVERVFWPGWLDTPATCTVADAIRSDLAVSLALPCRRLSCPNNLAGHLDAIGYPTLYHRSMAGRPVCLLQFGPAPTLEECGRALGISRERVRQLEAVACRYARVRARRLGLVVSSWGR